MKYTEEHEWPCAIEGDSVVVGITEHAAEQLGRCGVRWNCRRSRPWSPKGDEVCVIESVKAASDILAPVDGEITEVNEALTDNPRLGE